MAAVHTYWDSDSKELINMSHNSITQGLGNRIDIIIDSSHDLFTHGIPEDFYKMNDENDEVESK